MDVPQRFALDIQRYGPRYARAYRNSLETVAEQLLYSERFANSHIEFDFYPEPLQKRLISVDNGFGQSEFGYAVAQNPAYLRFRLEHSHVVAELSHFDCDYDTRGTRADDRDFNAVRLGALNLDAVEVVRGNKIFNRGNFHGLALDSAHAVPLALVAVVADYRADRGQRIVFEKHFARLFDIAV